MHFFFILFLLNTYTIADDSDSKYIDLLPEKEKQEFLERIARRILEEVQTVDDKPKKSSEIPDEQLNEHDAFVHRVIKEESESLRRQANDSQTTSDKNNIGRVLGIENEKNGESYVDLTLRTDKNRAKRESKRRVFTGFSPDDDNSTEHRSKESDIDIQVKNFKRNKNNSAETPILAESDVITKVDNDTVEDRTLNHDQNNENEAKSQYNANEHENKATKQDNLNNTYNLDSEIVETTEKNIDKLQENDSTTQNNLNDLLTNETLLGFEKQKTHDNTNLNKFSEIKIETNVTSNVLAGNITDLTLRSNNNNFTLDIESNKTKTKELKDSDVINIEIATVQSIKAGNILSTDESKNNTNPGQDTADVNITEKTEVSPTDSTLTDTTSTSTVKRQKRTESKMYKNEPVKNKLNDLRMTAASKKFARQVIKSLKLKLRDRSNQNDNFYYKTDRPPKLKRVEHNVFEISPDASPFVKQKPKSHPKLKQPKKKQLKSSQPNSKQLKRLQPDRKQPKSKQPLSMSEQPYHVPIYNYLPKNAFYNPQNVFGPNPDDGNDDEGYIIKNNEGYKFPSFMPKSANKLSENMNSKTNEQPFLAPVYYYSPKNAYYNHNNHFGPNNQDSKEKPAENDDVYDIADSEIDDNEEKNKERNEIEWQYYFDPHEPPKKGEPFEVNLPKSVVDYISNNTNVDLKGYIDTNYNKNERKGLSCCKYKKKCTKCNFEPKPSIENVVDEEKPEPMPLLETMSEIRHMLLKKKHFMLVKPNDFSKYDGYFEENNNKTLENDENDTSKSLRSSSPNNYDDASNKDKQEIHNIALDYYTRYFGDNSAEEKLTAGPQYEINNPHETKPVKDYKNKEYNANNPLKLIYYKYPNRNKYRNSYVKRHEKPLKPFEELDKTHKRQFDLENFNNPREFVKKKGFDIKNYQDIVKFLTKQAPEGKKYEYDMIKDLAKYLKDGEIMELYLKMERLKQRNLYDEKEIERNAVTKEFEVFEEVLGDMIKENNKALGNYDWLGTAVDLQSAIKKMTDMVESIQKEEEIHPSDLELLRYIIYLHKNAKDEIFQHKAKLRGMTMPHGKGPQHLLIREPGLIYRAWQVRRSAPGDLEEFQMFLEDLQDALYDLNTALKYIAMVTEFKNQQWFESLKQVYFESNRSQLLELLLHLCTTRLLGLIEESATKGLEDSFLEYLTNNGKEVDRTIEEFVFVLKLLEEIKQSK